jgi:hypothetical protein
MLNGTNVPTSNLGPGEDNPPNNMGSSKGAWGK